MAEEALAALYRAVNSRLAAAGNIWGTKVQADWMTADVARPYVVFTWAAGGSRNRLRKRDADLVLLVQCIADNGADALLGSHQIAEALDDQGSQDDTTTPLDAGSHWVITTSTQEEKAHRAALENAADYFASGHYYRFIMESS